MNDFDSDKRKNSRRQKIQKKSQYRQDGDAEYRDISRIKKRFKKDKEELRQEEIWEEWEDEIR